MARRLYEQGEKEDISEVKEVSHVGVQQVIAEAVKCFLEDLDEVGALLGKGEKGLLQLRETTVHRMRFNGLVRTCSTILILCRALSLCRLSLR